MLNVKLESCEYQLLKHFGLTRPGIETRSTDYEADALIYCGNVDLKFSEVTAQLDSISKLKSK